MSRAYRISISESVHRQIVAADEIRSRLDVLPVLPAEQTSLILRQILLERGFVEENGRCVREQDGTAVAIDPCSGEVSIRVATTHDLEAQATRQAVVWDDLPGSPDTTRQARDTLRKSLEAKLQRQAEAHQQAATARLDEALADLQPELAAIANAVTRDALKLRAAQLGAVREIREDAEAGTLTITVEV